MSEPLVGHRHVKGFTIVELLIVVTIIAVLAAISYVAYIGFQNRANNSVVEADIQMIAKQMELTRVERGHYPRAYTQFPIVKLNKSSYDTTENNIYYCFDRANDQYALGIRSKSRKGYIIANGEISAGVEAYASATCAKIDKTWVNDSTTWVMQGFTVSSSSWSSDWNWTN